MVKTLLILGTLLVAATASAATGVVTSSNGVNFRTRPNGRVIRALAHGETFKILSSRGIWDYVELSNGRKGYVYNRATEATTESGFCTSCSHARPPRKDSGEILRQAIHTRSSMVNGKFAPIMQPFLSAMNQCAPGCSYESWGVWPDERHKHEHSCHNSGSAIDIPGIRCGGHAYRPGSAKFKSFVGCMRAQHGLYVIHGSGEHKNHAHISLRSCEIGHIGKIRLK